jgi:protein arginine kinase
MLSYRELAERPAWVSRPGEDYDVVISSRVRLARNLSVLPFPPQLSDDERGEVIEAVAEAVSKTESGYEFARIDLRSSASHEVGVLVERNLISAQHRGTVLVRKDQEITIPVNDTDHVRVVAFKPGRSVSETYRAAESVDIQLESLLPYAVSLDLGYLTTELTNVGTGLRASVMVHLFGLSRLRRLKRSFRGLDETGITVRGFKSRDNGSLGDMFQIANQVTIGVSEEEILAKLEGATQQLVHYERQAREELARQSSVEDRVYRAYGLLTYARRVTAVEAIEELSWLRFGVAVGIINEVDLADATPLFFLSQESHVNAAASKHRGAGQGAGKLDEWRAWIIRQGLGSGDN